jgi:hypothetical protein
VKVRKLILAVGITGIVVATFFTLFCTGSSINRTNFLQIEPGMTRLQLEGILGGPARSEATGLLYEKTTSGVQKVSADQREDANKWVSDTAIIWVTFDDENRVLGASLSQVYRHRESTRALLRRLLRLEPEEEDEPGTDHKIEAGKLGTLPQENAPHLPTLPRKSKRSERQSSHP